MIMAILMTGTSTEMNMAQMKVSSLGRPRRCRAMPRLTPGGEQLSEENQNSFQVCIFIIRPFDIRSEIV
jgi:hypothetical protein